MQVTKSHSIDCPEATHKYLNSQISVPELLVVAHNLSYTLLTMSHTYIIHYLQYTLLNIHLELSTKA